MRKLVRLLAWSAIAGAALVGLLVALLLFVDVSLFRTQLERQVSAALGRAILFEGPLTLERSLTPRFTVAGLKIANPAWASRPHLATVDEFGIRVGLLPLLDGRLEINALEFAGVDLLVEVRETGENNLGIEQSTTATGESSVPVIEAISLRALTIGYRLPDIPPRSVTIDRVSGRLVPGEPLALNAQTVFNEVMIKLALGAEPAADGAGWDATLIGEIGRLSLRVAGRLAEPSAWDRGRYQVRVEGPDLDDIEALSGRDLLDPGSYEVDARVGFDLDDYLEIRDFAATIGDTDLQGTLDWDIDAPRPAIKVRLHSRRLSAEDLGLGGDPDDNEEGAFEDLLDLPLDPSLFAVVDIDAAVTVNRLDGLIEPVRDVALELYANNEGVRLAATASSVDARFVADARLPWGDRLSALDMPGLDVRTLLRYTALQGHAEATGDGPLYRVDLDDPAPELAVTRIEAKIEPEGPVVLRAAGRVDNQAVEARLQAAPLAQLLPTLEGPWDGLALTLAGERISVEVNGSVGKPLEFGGLDLRFRLEGDDLTDWLAVPGRVVLSGRYRDRPGARVLEDLQLRIGGSDLGGRIVIREDGQYPKITARLSSDRLRIDQLRPADAGGGDGQGGTGFDLRQPLEIGDLALHQLDVSLRVSRLEGAGLPVTDLAIDARSDGNSLAVDPARAIIDDSPFEASLTLPWGRRLTSLAHGGISVPRLVRYARLAVRADLAAEKPRYQTRLLGRDFAVELIAVEASADPGGELRLLADATLGGKPFEARLQAEPLERLLQRPEGPWQDLGLQLVAGDIQFAAEGSVARPLEGAGFDLRYQLRGAEIDRLLPLFDLVLPLEGAYTASGRFSDSPDRILLDDLRIVSGRSDIGGQMIIHRGKDRLRVDARLESDRIYLRELLPVSGDPDADRRRPRAIPDYDLPIERIRAYDGELTFKTRQLSTKFGDFGYLSFRASLQDGVLRIAPFRFNGWGGGLVTVDVTIDATVDPPAVEGSWFADDLDYGLLLRQAGAAEIAEGRVDVTLALSGTGRTRREMLANADGQLIIVGTEGRVASRRLDLWGGPLITTMLSPSWRSADVTELNCLVLRATIGDGVVTSEQLLVDTRRIAIGAVGSLDLETEGLDFVFAPRPKRATLVSLANPVRVTGTLLEPEISVTVLPAGRTAAAGGGLVAGLVNPAFLVFLLANTGSQDANLCLEAVDASRAVKAGVRKAEQLPEVPSRQPPARSLSPLGGCSPLSRR